MGGGLSVISSYIFYCLYRPLLTYDFKLCQQSKAVNPEALPGHVRKLHVTLSGSDICLHVAVA